jgi:alanyl-tRNA synthetase
MVCAKRLGIDGDFITPVTAAVIKVMKSYYPYLVEQQKNIIDVLMHESHTFQQTLERGYKLFNDAVNHQQLNGATIFQLVETYGFPFEIITDLAQLHNVKIDQDDYERRLKRHQDISRANVENKGMLAQNGNLLAFTTPATFDYDHLTLEHAKVIACFNEKFEPVNEIKNKG